MRKRIFGMFANDHHQDGRIAVWLAAPLGVQRYLVESEPEKYFVPPYVGVRGWVGAVVDRCTDAELRSLAVQAYCVVAPGKLQARVID